MEGCMAGHRPPPKGGGLQLAYNRQRVALPERATSGWEYPHPLGQSDRGLCALSLKRVQYRCTDVETFTPVTFQRGTP